MAEFYELDEAARILGMDPHELKTKADDHDIRSFRDGGNLRFRVSDIEEEARRRKLGSDPELSLSDLDLNIPPAVGGQSTSGEFDLSEFALGIHSADDSFELPHSSLSSPTSDAEILLNEQNLPLGPLTGSSSTILGMAGGGKLPSDSDVRLVPDHVKGASDSDVRIAPKQKAPSDSDVTLVNDDFSDGGFDDAPANMGDTAIRPSPLYGSSAEVPTGDSDFELTPSSVIDALQPESGSDFELTALDNSEEFLSIKGSPSDSDVTAADPKISGINLAKPSDSGINLQGVGGFNLGMDSIELAPLSGDEIPTAKKPAPAPAAKPAHQPVAAKPPAKAEKDIFEDTDFEVDALGSDEESDDRTMQLEAASDFELEDSESGSEVFAIDEDDVDQNAATAMAPAVLDEDEDDDGFAAVAEEVAASSGASGWDVESEGGTPSRSAQPMIGSGAANAEWGGLWVGLLSAATVLMLMLTFVAIDLVKNMYEFRGGGPASGLIKSLAGMFG